MRVFSFSVAEDSECDSSLVRERITGKITELFELSKMEFTDLFDHDDRIKLTPLSIRFTVKKLHGISLCESSRDAKGLAFQKILSYYEKNSRGQFFTPEPVIDFCVRLISPQSGESILDPACGSGGFLLSSLNFIKEHAGGDTGTIISSLYGMDINKSIARISKMKLLLELNVDSNIWCGNSLDRCHLRHSGERFDVILANPPFGAKICQPEILSQFELGHKWERSGDLFSKTGSVMKKQTVEILFIEQCLDLLKTGGRMGIVLPNGCFENMSLEFLRNYIQQRAKVLAVIKLPDETFIPYGTGVKTSLLFLEKRPNDDGSKYQVFFGRVTKPGYMGNKNGTPVYKRDNVGGIVFNHKGSPDIDQDFDDVIQAYKKFRAGGEFNTDNTFSVMSAEIGGRFDFDFYSPVNRNLIDSISSQKTVKLSDVCTIVKNKSPKLRIPDLNVRYVELSDVDYHTLEITDSELMPVHELPERASFEILQGDIITAVSGNSVGTRKHVTALVAERFSGCICTNGFRILRDIKIDPYYLLYYMTTEKFLKQIYMYRTGAAIPKVSDAFLSEVIIELPEQGRIEEISGRLRRVFDLRREANMVIEEIRSEEVNFNKS